MRSPSGEDMLFVGVMWSFSSYTDRKYQKESEKTARDGCGGKQTRVEEIVVESDDQRGRRCGSLSKCSK
jgi:hypothetical protein